MPLIELPTWITHPVLALNQEIDRALGGPVSSTLSALSGGAGSSTATEDPDSLQSRSMMTVLDLIGEGTIGGLVNGPKSIFLNGTPVQNDDGSFNFGSTHWDFKRGTRNQEPPLYIDGVETQHNIGVKVVKSIPNVYTITNANVDAVRAVVSIPALTTTDGATGDIHGAEVNFQFALSTNGGAYVDYGIAQRVKGKTKSKYQAQYLIELPDAYSTVSVRLTRITDDAVSSNLQNELWIEGYSEIINSKLSYPNSALAIVQVDSAQFSSLPSRGYLIDGLQIKVPDNYWPSTNTYNGIWAGVGAWTLASSSNPAWILYDLLTNERYGLGGFIDPSQIDAAQLYTIGKYCDEMVPDGRGGTEKRFQINTQIAGQKDAYGVIADICSSFRGMMYWAGGMASCMQDAPTDPSMIYGEANVIDGMFNYVGSARKDRHTVVLVTYNDPSNFYKQAIEYVEDAEMVAQFGVKQANVVAFGCTSRGQAARVGRWMLYTERYESDLITFGVGPDSVTISPGDVVQINDPSKAGKRMAGRVIGATSTTVTLDAPVELLGPGASITLRVPDGSVVTRGVLENAGTHTTLSWISALSSVPDVNSMFVVSEPSLTPQLARVVSIAENDNNTYTVSALRHIAGKYTFIETGLKLDAPPISGLNVVPLRPRSIEVSNHVYRTGLNTVNMLDVSWDDPQLSIRSWAIRVKENNGNWAAYTSKAQHFELAGARDGSTYYVEVQAVNSFGNYGPAITASHLATSGRAESVIVYKWAVSKPATPTGTGTYTWATGTFLAPGDWTIEPGLIVGTTFVLWSAEVALTDMLLAATTDFDWSTAKVIARGRTGADGAAGDAGAAGPKAATAYLYQWSPITPAAPTGTSTYTWASGAVSGYGGAGGWGAAAGSNPGTPGLNLWVASIAVSGASDAITSSVDWSAGTPAVNAYSQNGANGAAGMQSAKATVYRWDATIPAGPVGASTYTWATSSFGAAPALWQLTPGSSPTPGFTLWAAEVSLVDSASNLTTNFNWTSAGVSARGYAGTAGANGTNGTNGSNGSNGSPGTAGDSYRTAYLLSTVPTPSSNPSSEYNAYSSSTPGSQTWGLGGSWSTTVPSIPTGYYLYQSDGIYYPGSNSTWWSIPYWSSLKVGSLSAISANLGTITAGEITVGSSPAVSGRSMTGYGTHLYGDGRFVMGTPTRNIGYNGSNLFANGLAAAAVTAVSTASLLSSGPTTSFDVTTSLGSITVVKDTFSVTVAGSVNIVTTNTAAFKMLNILVVLYGNGGLISGGICHGSSGAIFGTDVTSRALSFSVCTGSALPIGGTVAFTLRVLGECKDAGAGAGSTYLSAMANATLSCTLTAHEVVT